MKNIELQKWSSSGCFFFSNILQILVRQKRKTTTLNDILFTPIDVSSFDYRQYVPNNSTTQICHLSVSVPKVAAEDQASIIDITVIYQMEISEFRMSYWNRKAYRTLGEEPILR